MFYLCTFQHIFFSSLTCKYTYLEILHSGKEPHSWLTNILEAFVPVILIFLSFQSHFWGFSDLHSQYYLHLFEQAKQCRMRWLGTRRREDADIWLTSGGHVWGGGWDINVCRVMCLFGVANLRGSAFSFVLPPTTLPCGGLSVRASKTKRETLALLVPPPMYLY